MRQTATVLLLLSVFAAANAEKISDIENGIRSTVAVDGQVKTFSLSARMARHRVPGLSLAVINDGRIEWARGYGTLAADRDVPVNRDTLFQAASISKPVTALATVRLAERGVLNLDRDVNEYLRTWKVSRNDFMPRAPITLRRITSHSAGFTIHGFPGYPMGSPLPSIIQVLDGKAPANTDPVRVVRRPGREIRYSGGGVTVEQLVLMDVTGKAFPDIMRELVLDPLGMKRSSFQQPLPEKLSDNAARAHGLTGRPIGVRWHVYPEMAAAGLWTTATDLARFAITVRDAALGRRQEIASARFARAMLTPSGLGQERNDYGVGFRIAGRGSNLFFGHSGANRGYQADLILFLDSGAGAAIMTNSDRGRGLIDEILATLDHVYAWPGDTFAPKPRFVGQVSEKQLERFTGAYRMRFAFGGSAEIFVQDAEPYLNVDLGPLGDSVFLPESENRLFSDDLDLDLEFVDTDVVLSVGSRVIGHGTRTEP